MEHHYPIHISEFSTDSSEKSLSLAFTTYLMGSDCLAFYASHKDSSRSPNIYSCVFWIKQISNCLSLACTSYLSKESNYLADETFQQDNSGCPLTLHLFVVFWIKQFLIFFAIGCNETLTTFKILFVQLFFLIEPQLPCLAALEFAVPTLYSSYPEAIWREREWVLQW